MPTETTGRTLDDEGRPVPGTGFRYDTDGLVGGLLADRTGPLASHPTRPVWSAPIEGDSPERHRSVGLFGPGYEGPPEHYHVESVERFDVHQGHVEFTLDGTSRTVETGETLAVEAGTRHTFDVPGEHDDGDGETDAANLTVYVLEVEPPGRITRVFPTLSGLAHDPERDEDDPLQQAVTAKALERDTVFTGGGRLAELSTEVLAPLGRARGYQAAYGRYQQAAFWNDHVEQPRD